MCGTVLDTLSYHLDWAVLCAITDRSVVWLYGQIHGLATREEPNKRKYGIDRTSSRRLGSTTETSAADSFGHQRKLRLSKRARTTKLTARN